MRKNDRTFYFPRKTIAKCKKFLDFYFECGINNSIKSGMLKLDSDNDKILFSYWHYY